MDPAARLSRISNCRRIEQYLGDLDQAYELDGLTALIEKLELSRGESTPRHPIPIDGDLYTGTATLRSAARLYQKFCADETSGMRRSSSECEKLERSLSLYLPGEQRLTQAAQLLGRLIERANAKAPGSWVLSKRDQGIHLTVTFFKVFGIARKRVFVAFTTSEAPGDLRARVEEEARQSRESEGFLSLDDTTSGRISPELFFENSSMFQDLLERFVDRVTDKYTTTSFSRYYSPVAKEWLESRIGRELPSPAYPEGITVDDSSSEGDAVSEEVASVCQSYSLNEVSAATGVATETLTMWARAIERKGQAILYGPPGTGKTFMAEHLARHLVGAGDGFVETLQFHPAYAYEDFMEGIRPESKNGSLSYPIVPGRFRSFCERAASRKGTSVLIIDEINRANLARVLGELMYLLEYRQKSVPLASGTIFSIPSNVRIIGTMNTADRSIALVDHALRRRFAFLQLRPDYDVLRKFQNQSSLSHALVKVLQELNGEIEPHYQVGISFFLVRPLEEHLADIWRMEIEPYLEEYFSDSTDRWKRFSWKQVAARVNLGALEPTEDEKPDTAASLLESGE